METDKLNNQYLFLKAESYLQDLLQILSTSVGKINLKDQK